MGRAAASPPFGLLSAQIGRPSVDLGLLLRGDVPFLLRVGIAKQIFHFSDTRPKKLAAVGVQIERINAPASVASSANIGPASRPPQR